MPTRSKVQYLIHLDDCRRRGVEDISHALTLLKRISRAVESSDFCCHSPDDQKSVRKRVLDTEKDLKFLRSRVHSLAQPISTIREQIVQQMELSQGQRGLILTVAAALFIPMSFVSVSVSKLRRDRFGLLLERDSLPFSLLFHLFIDMWS